MSETIEEKLARLRVAIAEIVDERNALRARVAELEAALDDEPVLRTPPKEYGERLVPESRVKALIEAGDAMAEFLDDSVNEYKWRAADAWREARDELA